jgi:adenosylcobinamide kinase/adenosylcobinamide-phosphate guanylyltransferase
MMQAGVTFLTGGGRSGKSRLALAASEGALRPAFVATAEAFDEEMRERIRRHQEERSDRFLTVEEPLDLAGVLRGLPAEVDLVLVDCLTVWLGNLMYHREVTDAHGCREIDELLAVLRDPPCHIVLVSNEVGMGIIPADAESRLFRDVAGRVNQRVAEVADTVVLAVSGLPLVVKGELWWA